MRIAVIGGGAAGFFGALSAAETDRSAKVVIFEATGKPLDKVRISGGGRCNVTHNCFDPLELIKNYPRGRKELLGPYNRFGPRDTVSWFESRGVKLKTESDGRMFPVTDDSATIAECLLSEAEKLHVELRLNGRVKKISPRAIKSQAQKFEIEMNNGEKSEFDRVLIATGNSPRGYRFAEALGHRVVDPVPSLFTFKVKDTRINDLSGVSFNNATLSLGDSGKKALSQSGPLLITHWGFSGPAALKLSAWEARILHRTHYRTQLTINFLPGAGADEIYTEILSYKKLNSKKQISTDSPVAIPKRYWQRIVEYTRIKDRATWADISRESMNLIVNELTRATFDIRGKGIFKEEFVTCGGVDLREIDFKTMQSKICRGLFIAGEALDIDGITGGFNFQSAWTTAWIAGQSLVV